MTLISLLLRNGLFYTAVSILLLHSWVPHQHHTVAIVAPTFTSCVHVENTLLGFLGRIFHQDLGDEHLENYQGVKKVDFDYQQLFNDISPVADRSNWVLELNTYNHIPFCIPLNHQDLVLVSKVRGPPSVSINS
jgi:hypothetical protein